MTTDSIDQQASPGATASELGRHSAQKPAALSLERGSVVERRGYLIRRLSVMADLVGLGIAGLLAGAVTTGVLTGARPVRIRLPDGTTVAGLAVGVSL